MLLLIDATTFHDYAAEWTPEGIAFVIDGQQVKTVAQSITYPMQFMLGLYEFLADPGAEVAVEFYPKGATVSSARGSRYRG